MRYSNVLLAKADLVYINHERNVLWRSCLHTRMVLRSMICLEQSRARDSAKF